MSWRYLNGYLLVTGSIYPNLGKFLVARLIDSDVREDTNTYTNIGDHMANGLDLDRTPLFGVADGTADSPLTLLGPHH